MYLQQLYKHNKWLFSLVILFITGQVFVILIWGIVVTPFYNYGMYSEVMIPKKEYWLYEVNVNGKKLQGKNFSPQQWDKIILPLYYYSSVNVKSNALFYSDVKRIMNKMFLNPNEKRFLQNCNEEQFTEWYKRYLSASLSSPVNALHIRYRKYLFKDEMLRSSNTFYTLSQLCH